MITGRVTKSNITGWVTAFHVNELENLALGALLVAQTGVSGELVVGVVINIESVGDPLIDQLATSPQIPLALSVVADNKENRSKVVLVSTVAVGFIGRAGEGELRYCIPYQPPLILDDVNVMDKITLLETWVQDGVGYLDPLFDIRSLPIPQVHLMTAHAHWLAQHDPKTAKDFTLHILDAYKNDYDAHSRATRILVQDPLLREILIDNDTD